MNPMRYLLPFVRKYRRQYVLGIVLTFVSTVFSLVIPLIGRQVINELNDHGVVAQDLLRYGLIMVTIALLNSAVGYAQRMSINGTGYLVEFDMREALFNRLLSLDQGFYGQMYTGDLMTRVTNDLSMVRQFVGPSLNGSFTGFLFLIGSSILMLMTNAQLALVVLIMLPIVTILLGSVGGHLRRSFRKVQDQFGVITTKAQENFSGIRTIKAYAQEDPEMKVFLAENEKYRTLNLRYVLLNGLLWPSIGLILGLTSAFVLFVGGRFVASGAMTIGDLVMFNTYLAMLGWPMIAMGWTVNHYQQASASLGRIGEVLHRRPSIRTPEVLPENYSVVGNIEFRDVGVRFDYTPSADELDNPALRQGKKLHDQWALRHISFTIPYGSSMAIVGATGAGKTTLINLLARVRDPDEGQILINGRDIRELPLDELRRSLGYVPQDTFLFSVPLRENVTFGRPESSDEEIMRAAEVARLSNDLNQFPDGLNTMLGERGVTLSGGQKQRTALARAVLRDPNVLILDDSLASVDTHTAAEILAGLRDVMKGRTSIMIAQRIASVKDADRVIVLHNGEIVEQGTHRELSQGDGRYAAMYRRELLESEYRVD
jgi:ATP-binding cassette subfamily B multidrug efflux pump